MQKKKPHTSSTLAILSLCALAFVCSMQAAWISGMKDAKRMQQPAKIEKVQPQHAKAQSVAEFVPLAGKPIKISYNDLREYIPPMAYGKLHIPSHAKKGNAQ